MARHEDDSSQKLSPADHLIALLENLQGRQLSNEEVIEIASVCMVTSQQALADAARLGENGVVAATVSAALATSLTVLGVKSFLHGLDKSHLSTPAITTGIERSIDFWQGQSSEEVSPFSTFRERQITNLNNIRSALTSQTAN